MKNKTDLAIIGGGIVGLSLAYYLTENGVRDIVVLEKGYLGCGATGRCGGGVRQQWSTEDNIRLMKENIEIFSKFATQFGVNTWFRQGGYLFLVRREEERKILQDNVRLQNSCGVGTRFLEPEETKKIVPFLNIDGLKGASYNATDGIIFPFSILWGYTETLLKRGVEIKTFVEVNEFEVEGKKIKKVVTNQGTLEVKRVVNAAGAWSAEVARRAGIELPNQPFRHEIMATESLKYFLNPMVVLLKEGLYFSQSSRGEIVGGIADPEEKPGFNDNCSFHFLNLFTKEATAVLPLLKEVKILRQWAGYYDVTPDAGPILGPVDELENFYQCNGFMGHGFMIAPAICQRVARFIAKGERVDLVEKYNPRRFKEGKLYKESFIIG